MICDKHKAEPARIYCGCIGCEVEELNKTIERLRDEIRVLWKCVRNKATEQQSLEAVKRGDYLTSEELLADLKGRMESNA